MSDAVSWPYPIEWDKTEEVDTDVLVIGGGASGCFAAMGAASGGATGALVRGLRAPA